MLRLAHLSFVTSALAQTAAAPAGKLVKVVLPSRHGVRSPIPSADELATWTKSKWPVWTCDGKTCGRGQLTPKGGALAEQMGTFYGSYLSELVADACPAASDVFLWADLDERTQSTGRALLRGFRPACDAGRYFHIASTPPPDRIFHPVTKGGSCKLDATRAEKAILERAGGDIATYIATQKLRPEMSLAQKSLQCCVCNKLKSPCAGKKASCSLQGMPSCVVARSKGGDATRVQPGGSLRIASTFAELLLLEYATGSRPAMSVGATEP